MSGEDIRRLRVIRRYLYGELTQIEAASKLNLSVRQIRRLAKRVMLNGDAGVIHGLVGKKGNRSFGLEKENLIIDIWKDKYQESKLNFTHFTEKLNEKENIKVSREKVRKLLRKNNLSERKVKKGKKHRSHRDRRQYFGELLQQDTSPHDWLNIGVQHHLVVIIDDSTSTLLHAQLFESDGTMQNMITMREVYIKYGLPMAVYTDKASWFHYSGQGDKVGSHKSCKEKKEVRTQIGRASDQLGIELIAAHSPQAKGRVERANGTLQDRLISELSLAGITNLPEANEFIKHIFIPDFNKRFAQSANSEESVFIKLVNPNILDNILCLEFYSKVQNDNTVKRSTHYHLQLLSTPNRAHWVRAKVKVLIHLDGSVSVFHADTNESIPFKVIALKIPKEFKYGESDLNEADTSILQKRKKTGQV